MTEDVFEVGDIVALQHDFNFSMTVSDIRPNGAIGCIWWANSLLQYQLFPPKTLLKLNGALRHTSQQ